MGPGQVKEKKLQYLALHILDTLNCDPLGAFVTFPLLDKVFLLLAGIEARDDTEGYRRGERATGRGRDTYRETLDTECKNEEKNYHASIAYDS